MKLTTFLLSSAILLFTISAAGQSYVQDYGAGKFDASLAEARRVMKREPSNWQAHYYAGLSLIQLDKEKDAVKVLQKAVSINGTEAQLRAALSYAYLLRNDKKRPTKLTKPLSSTSKIPKLTTFSRRWQLEKNNIAQHTNDQRLLLQLLQGWLLLTLPNHSR